MASYDKAKLLAMMERRRAAYLVVSDLLARQRDAKEEKGGVLNRIRTESRHLPAGYLDRLLALPTDEAFALSSEEVETYTDGTGDAARRYRTGVNFDMYRRYVSARDVMARLTGQVELAKENAEQFAVVPRLVDAVREWGFADPELEM